MTRRLARYVEEIYADLEACAEACETYDWCLSFDHHATRRWCALSQLDAAAAGGLTQTSLSDATDHYERRATSALRWAATTSAPSVPPTLTILPRGVVKIVGNRNMSGSKISILVNLHAASRIDVNAMCKLESGLIAEASSNVSLIPGATLILSGKSDIAYEFSKSAFLSLSESSAMHIVEGAAVQLPKQVAVPTSLTKFSLIIEDASVIRATGPSDDGSLALDLGNKGDLTLVKSASIDVANLTVTAYLAYVCGDCVISAAMMDITISGNLTVDGSLNADGGSAKWTGTRIGDALGSVDAGGSGGGHAGAGGSGLGGGESGSRGSGGIGCLWWPRTPGGAGGHVSSQGTQGSYGGGVVAVHVAGIFSLHGTLSANGMDGMVNKAAGGGAGGSVILNASKLVGTGVVAADGGAGDFPGGWLAGSGGGGGRVLLIIPDADNNSTGFTGSLSARAGVQEDSIASSIRRDSGHPGAGTVLIFNADAAGNGTLFLSVSGGEATPAISREATPLIPCAETSNIPNSVLASAAANGIVDGLWLGGAGRASIRRGESLTVRGYRCSAATQRLLQTIWTQKCTSAVVGDSTGRLDVHGELSLPLNTTIENAQVMFDLSFGRLQGARHLKVQGSSAAFLLTGSGGLAPANGFADWHFNGGASLAQICRNGTATISLAFLGIDGSIVSVAGNLSLNSTFFTIQDGSTFRAHETMLESLPYITVARGICNIKSSLTISGVEFRIAADANATLAGFKMDLTSGTVLRNFGTMRIIASHGHYRIGADAHGVNMTSSAPLLVNHANGTCTCLGDKITIEAALHNYGAVAAQQEVEVLLVGGGIQYDTGSMSVAFGAILSIGGAEADAYLANCATASDCTFRFAASSLLEGGGKIISRSRGMLSLPSVVMARPYGVTIAASVQGTIISSAPSSSGSWLLGELVIAGGDYVIDAPLGNTLRIDNVTISSGALRVLEGSAVVISALNLRGGSIQLNSGCNVTAVSTEWSKGDVYGPGAVYFTRHLKLLGGEAAGESPHGSSMCPRLLDRAQATIKGIGTWTNGGIVVVSQASKLIIAKGAAFNVSLISQARNWRNDSLQVARLIPGGVLYNFSQISHAYLDVWPPVLELPDVTLNQCASACLGGKGTVEVAKGHEVAARLVVEMSSLACQSFDYEYHESRCIINVRNSESDRVLSSSRWHHFDRHLNWETQASSVVLEENAIWNVDAPSIYNYPGFAIDVFVVTRAASSTFRVGSQGHVSLRGGGTGNGTFEVGQSGALHVALPEGGVRNGASFKFEGQTSSAAIIRGATSAQLVIAGGGPHFLPAVIHDRNLQVIVKHGAIAVLPADADVFIESLFVSNSSSLMIGLGSQLNLSSSLVIQTGSKVQFEDTGRVASPLVYIESASTLTSAGSLELVGHNELTTGWLDVMIKDEESIISASLTLNATTRCSLFLIGRGSVVRASRLFVACRDATVEANGTAHADGLGGEASSRGSAPHTTGTVGGGGGGHGGDGGPAALGARGGVAFGSADAPNVDVGGGSGGPMSGGGRGGGVVSLTSTSGPLTINGLVSSRGANGVAALGGGGGAGGSVWLEATNSTLNGTGRIRADGGDGQRAPRNWLAGGGGGGGRIRIYAAHGVLFDGIVSTVGGHGYDAAAGWGWSGAQISCRLESCTNVTTDRRVNAASGTVYIVVEGAALTVGPTADHLRRVVAAAAGRGRVLWVDNGGTSPRAGLTSSVGDLETGEVDAVVVTGGARLKLDRGGRFAIGCILGDARNPGIVLVDNSTTLDVADSNSASSIIVHNITLEIARGSVLSNSNATGLHIGDKGIVALSPGSTCGGGNDEFRCELSNVTIDTGGVLSLLAASRNNSESEQWLAPTLRFNNLAIYGRLDADGAGGWGGASGGLVYNATTGNVKRGVFAMSAGAYGPAGGGGGGHAGEGGDGLGGSGGSFRKDSVVSEPKTLGAGGGGCQEGDGGHGGGRILLQVRGNARIEGTLSARGLDGKGSCGGGGAGGSVWLKVDGACFGGGALSAPGGSGSRSRTSVGGDGGGGRVALSCGRGDATSIRLDATQGGKGDLRKPPQGERGGAFPGATGAIAQDALPRAAPGTALMSIREHNLWVGSSDDEGVSSALAANNVSFPKLTSIYYFDSSNISSAIIASLRISRNAVVEIATPRLRVLKLGSANAIEAAKLKLVENATLEFLDATSVLPTGIELWVGAGVLAGSCFDSSGGGFVVQHNATLALTTLGRTNVSSAVANYSFHSGLRVSGRLRIESPSGARVVVIETSAFIVSRGGHAHADGWGDAGALNDGLFVKKPGNGALGGQSLAYSARLHNGQPRGAGGGHSGLGGGGKQASPIGDEQNPDNTVRRGYGSAIRPNSSGSGGGASDRAAGSAGGGAFRIRVAGNCVVDGVVSANGLDSTQGAGAGAGGSIWLDALNGNVTGTGIVSANGGDALGYLGGAGAGGRVAVTARVLRLSLTATPGTQSDAELTSPAAGTLFINESMTTSLLGDGASCQNCSSHFAVFVDENFAVDFLGVRGIARLSLASGIVQVGQILDSDGIIMVEPHASLLLENGTVHGVELQVYGYLEILSELGASRSAVVALLDSSRMNVSAVTLADDAELQLSATGSANAATFGKYVFTSLNATFGGLVRVSSRNDTDYATMGSVELVVRNSIVVEAGGGVIGDGGGPHGGHGKVVAGEGGPAGGVDRGGGGGHGGQGGYTAVYAMGGQARGNATAPVGGGGGGAAGYRGDKGGAGGAGMWISVGGDAHLDGVISSNGEGGEGGGGGGAGGAIWLVISGRLTGNGTISADGGSASLLFGEEFSPPIEAGGAGSGGRVAIECQLNQFTGSVSAIGGVQRAAQPERTRELSLAFLTLQYLDTSGGTTPVDATREGVYLAAAEYERLAQQPFSSSAASAAPGTVFIRNLTSSSLSIINTKQRTSINSTATTVTTLAETAQNATLRHTVNIDWVELDSNASLFVPGVVDLTVRRVLGCGATVIAAGATIGGSGDNYSLEIGGNATMILHSTARIMKQTTLVVEESGKVELIARSDGPLTVGSLHVRGMLSGGVIWLNVTRDVHIGGLVSADGLGDWGAAPGIDDKQRWENEVARRRGGSSSLGGSGGGHGGGGGASLGAHYVETLADAALHLVNATDSPQLDVESAQFLLSNFPSGVPNASLATSQLLEAVKRWSTSYEYEDRGASAVADELGAATGSALLVQVESGGSMLARYLRTIRSRIFATLGGTASGDDLEPTTAGGGGGAKHVVSGHGGRGGGIVRILAGGTIDITGTVSANGARGGKGGGGGGAGGSIWFETCSSLSGNGNITADGGPSGNTVPPDVWSVYFDSHVASIAGSGGGGRIALAPLCSAASWWGLVAARPGGLLLPVNPLSSMYLGTAAWASLTVNASIRTTSNDGKIGQGDYVDLRSSISRRPAVQVIASRGSGNGSVYAHDEYNAVVRGSWRLRYRSSAWSTRLSTQATAQQVKVALADLDTLDEASVAVTRVVNENRTAWLWFVAFFDDPSVTASELPRTPPLIEVDTDLVYSTSRDASITVSRASDDNFDIEGDYAPASYGSRDAVDAIVLGASFLGADYSAKWIAPTTLRLTVQNATGSASKDIVKAGNLSFGLNMTLSDQFAKWIPHPARSIPATWYPR